MLERYNVDVRCFYILFQLMSNFHSIFSLIKDFFIDLLEELREEILLHSCRRLVENVAVFRNLPKDILASIVANLKFELYLPNDVIVKAGAQGDCMFFLASGSIAVFTPIGKEVSNFNIVVRKLILN